MPVQSFVVSMGATLLISLKLIALMFFINEHLLRSKALWKKSRQYPNFLEIKFQKQKEAKYRFQENFLFIQKNRTVQGRDKFMQSIEENVAVDFPSPLHFSNYFNLANSLICLSSRR